MTEYRSVKPNEDPVRGMTVDIVQARAKGLTTTNEAQDYGTITILPA